MKPNCKNGFITIDVLIAGVILTAGIAVSMYLFRLGFDYMDRANNTNTIALKISQTPAFLRTLDFAKESGTEELGDGVMLKWSSKLLAQSRPQRFTGEFKAQSVYDIYLYEVVLNFEYKGTVTTYKVNVLRSKSLSATEETGF